MEYTYNGIKAEIETRLSEKSQWRKTLFDGAYARIIDAVAFVFEKIVYIAEFLFIESRYSSATKRESLLTLVKPLQYVPYRKKGATGELWISSDPDFSNANQYVDSQIYIPKWTVFTDTDKEVKVYTYLQDYYYYTGTIGNLELAVREGTPKSYEYIASGTANEIFYIYSGSIENNDVEVFIVDATGTILQEVNIIENLYFANDIDTYSCEIINSADMASVGFLFGDNITARQLNAGERILVKYADTSGSEGNIGSKGVVTTTEEVLFDASGNESQIYITNDDAITGGSEHETTESIRQNANNLFYSGYRLGSPNDWSTLLASVSFIYKAIVWTIATLGGSSAVAEQNQVFITAISSSGENLTEAQQLELTTEYINERKSLTESVSFEDFVKIYLKFDVVAKIQNKSVTVMSSLIKQTLDSNYGILNSEFQNSIFESNFYRVIDDISDIVRHETEIYTIEKNVSQVISNYEIAVAYDSENTSILENQILLLEGTVKLWIKRKISGTWLALQQVGETNPLTDNRIIGLNGYSIVSDSILYASNSISYNIDSIVNSTPVNTIPIRSSDFLDDTGISWWSLDQGTLEWNAGEYAEFEFTGSASDGIIYKEGLVAPNILYNITFRAKSSTVTDSLSVYLDDVEADENINPNLTSSWQDYSFSATATGTVGVSDLALIINFGIQSIGDVIDIDNIVCIDALPYGSFGVRNPDNLEDDGYILYLEYKTKDGSGKQINSVRIPRFNQISDIDEEDFVSTTLTYI